MLFSNKMEEEEQEDNMDISKQSETASISSSESEIAFFDILQQSSSDREIISALCSIIRISSSTIATYTQVDISKLFDVCLPSFCIQERFPIDEIEADLKKLFNMTRREVTGEFNIIALVNACPKPLSVEKCRTRAKRGLTSFSRLVHLLNHSQIWMLRYDGQRINEEDSSEFRMKVMSLLMFAAMTSTPKVLLFLLQHGTRFLDESEGITTEPSLLGKLCMKYLLHDILQGMLNFDLWDFSTMKLKLEFSSLPEKTRQSCWKMRFLMRTISNPYVTTTKLIGSSVKEGSSPEVQLLHEIYDALFPGLEFGRPRPPSLQHACRCVIRQRLHENWQLPDGITQLELPKILCDYVNLLED